MQLPGSSRGRDSSSSSADGISYEDSESTTCKAELEHAKRVIEERWRRDPQEKGRLHGDLVKRKEQEHAGG